MPRFQKSLEGVVKFRCLRNLKKQPQTAINPRKILEKMKKIVGKEIVLLLYEYLQEFCPEARRRLFQNISILLAVFITY